MIPKRMIGDIVTCPICGKSYKYTESNKFLRRNDFVCSWGCFMGYEERPVEEVKLSPCEASEHRKRGRPKKDSGVLTLKEEVLF